MNGRTRHYFSPDAPDDPDAAGPGVELELAGAGRSLSVATSAGVFSARGLDPGTSVLLRHVPPPPPVGDLLDIGCGWGPLALVMAARSPAATVWAVDVNPRALAATAANAAANGLVNVRAVLPQEVPTGTRFAGAWSNPPIRIGKPALHDLLAHWLPRLLPDADAWLVVQRNLGSDSLQRWLAGHLVDTAEVARAGSAKGYRVLRVSRVAPAPPPG